MLPGQAGTYTPTPHHDLPLLHLSSAGGLGCARARATYTCPYLRVQRHGVGDAHRVVIPAWPGMMHQHACTCMWLMGLWGQAGGRDDTPPPCKPRRPLPTNPAPRRAMCSVHPLPVPSPPPGHPHPASASPPPSSRFQRSYYSPPWRGHNVLGGVVAGVVWVHGRGLEEEGAVVAQVAVQPKLRDVHDVGQLQGGGGGGSGV